MRATSNGVFQGDNPIHFALPLLMLQICFVLALTRSLAFALRPLRQPRVVAEIIGGILLGPSAFGQNQNYLSKIFPKESMPVLETFADMGLLFFLFMVGLELDLNSLRKTGKQALLVAITGICLPFVAGIGVSFVLHSTVSKDAKFSAFLVFMGVAMSITAFPVLARILAERKLLTTDVGQIAMSAAAVNDVIAWILLALAVSLSGSGKTPAVAAWVLLCGIGFIVAMFVILKPLISWIMHVSPDEQRISEISICVVFAGVLACGFITDAIGIHSIFGAFIFGLVIPKNGPVAKLMIEKIEDFVIVLMLPLYFASSGLKTNIRSIHGAVSIGLLILVITTACLGKVLGTLAVSLAHGMELRKGLALGFLMNTKGLVELIVLNIGKERGVLNDETFAIMVLMALFTTFITTPIVMALYKPARTVQPYVIRKLAMASRKDELRILMCIHGLKNVSAIINVVGLIQGSPGYPLRVYVLHLVQMSERSSAVMMIHQVRKNGRPCRGSNLTDPIAVALGAFAQLIKIKVRSMTSVSEFEDMHEDICITAADKRAAILVLPFHKHPTHDGILETINGGFQFVNRQVLKHAPCSVAILVDRGIGTVALGSLSFHVAVFFFGGANDREALVLGCRMAEHESVKLNIFHFVDVGEAGEVVAPSDKTSYAVKGSAPDTTVGELRGSFPGAIAGIKKTIKNRCCTLKDSANLNNSSTDGMNAELEKKLDLECISAAKQKSQVSGNQTILYEQIVTRDHVQSVLDMAKGTEFNLIIIGYARRLSQFTEQMDYAELGSIGSAVLSAETEIKSSLVVLQQYDPTVLPEHQFEVPRSAVHGNA